MAEMLPTPRRPDETVREACIRNAVDAVYWARDHGGTMHEAGELAAVTVLAVLANEEDFRAP